MKMFMACLAYAAAATITASADWATLTSVATAIDATPTTSTVASIAGWTDSLTYATGLLDSAIAEAMTVTMVEDLAASDVVLIKLPAGSGILLFTIDMIDVAMLDADDAAALPGPTLVGFTDGDADFPGAALQVPADAEDGDTYFAALSVTPSGSLIPNTGIFALVVGEETKACAAWGNPDLWSCGSALWLWIIIILAIGVGAYFFLM